MKKYTTLRELDEMFETHRFGELRNKIVGHYDEDPEIKMRDPLLNDMLVVFADFVVAFEEAIFDARRREERTEDVLAGDEDPVRWGFSRAQRNIVRYVVDWQTREASVYVNGIEAASGNYMTGFPDTDIFDRCSLYVEGTFAPGHMMRFYEALGQMAHEEGYSVLLDGEIVNRL